MFRAVDLDVVGHSHSPQVPMMRYGMTLDWKHCEKIILLAKTMRLTSCRISELQGTCTVLVPQI